MIDGLVPAAAPSPGDLVLPTSRPVRAIVVSGLLALAALAATAGSARARETLADSSIVDQWTTSNGLRVVTRHIAGARHVVTALCYRMGSRDDPDGREGLAELAAQVAFLGRAGDVPQRTLAELDQLRPSGWSLSVEPHLTTLTESAPKAMFPGVLHQVCQRLRGIGVSDSVVARARGEVRRRLLSKYDARVDGALYFLCGELTSGHSAVQAQRYGSGEGIERLGVKDVKPVLAQRLVPANCSLTIVGDLEDFDFHRLLEREVGGVAAGVASPPVAWGKLGSAQAALNRSDLTKPVAVLGILTPPLTDTLHAHFTAFIYSAAAHCRKLWGPPVAPLTTRFQYMIPSDPELVRVYPPSHSGDEAQPDETWAQALSSVANQAVDSASVQQACRSVLWSVGGPLTPERLRRAKEDPVVLQELATTHAALAQYGDEAFWAKYRERLVLSARLDLAPFIRSAEDPRRQVKLVLSPGP